MLDILVTGQFRMARSQPVETLRMQVSDGEHGSVRKLSEHPEMVRSPMAAADNSDADGLK